MRLATENLSKRILQQNPGECRTKIGVGINVKVGPERAECCLPGITDTVLVITQDLNNPAIIDLTSLALANHSLQLRFQDQKPFNTALNLREVTTSNRISNVTRLIWLINETQ